MSNRLPQWVRVFLWIVAAIVVMAFATVGKELVRSWFKHQKQSSLEVRPQSRGGITLAELQAETEGASVKAPKLNRIALENTFLEIEELTSQKWIKAAKLTDNPDKMMSKEELWILDYNYCSRPSSEEEIVKFYNELVKRGAKNLPPLYVTTP